MIGSNLYFRLAISLAALEEGANFYIHGVPAPDLVNYQPHAVTRPQSLGGMARHGYRSLTLTWSQLSAQSANWLRSVIDAAEAVDGIGNGTIYFTAIRTDATSEAPAWIDGHGKAHMPNWIPQGRAAGKIYSNVSLTINNVSIDTQPSSVIT